MIFPYKKSPIGNFRPIIKILVAALNGTDDQKTHAWMLVDSGADISLFDKEIAPILGVDITKIKPEIVKGIGNGQVEAYPATIKLVFDNHPVPIRVMFCDVGENGYGMLGHIGFFEHFRVAFDTREQTVEVEHNWKP